MSMPATVRNGLTGPLTRGLTRAALSIAGRRARRLRAPGVPEPDRPRTSSGHGERGGGGWRRRGDGAVGPEAARLELVVREVDGPGGPVEHDLEVTGLTTSATVGDLVDAVGARLTPAGDRSDLAAVIDGVPVTLDRPLRSSGLRRGSVLTLRSAGLIRGAGGEWVGETTGETGPTARTLGRRGR